MLDSSRELNSIMLSRSPTIQSCLVVSLSGSNIALLSVSYTGCTCKALIVTLFPYSPYILTTACVVIFI